MFVRKMHTFDIYGFPLLATGSDKVPRYHGDLPGMNILIYTAGKSLFSRALLI